MSSLGAFAASSLVPVGAAGGLEFQGLHTADISGGAAFYDYTFSSVAIGSAVSDRTVIIVIMCTSDYGSLTNFDFTSLTIGGVSATVDVTHNTATGRRMLVAIAHATVPTGTTADVFVDPTASITNQPVIALGVYSYPGAVSVVDSDAIHSETDTDAGVTISTAAGGFLIAGGDAWHGSSIGVSGWSDATEDDSELVNAANGKAYRLFSVASTTETTSGTDTPTVTFDTNTDNNLGFAAVAYEPA